MKNESFSLDAPEAVTSVSLFAGTEISLAPVPRSVSPAASLFLFLGKLEVMVFVFFLMILIAILCAGTVWRDLFLTGEAVPNTARILSAESAHMKVNERNIYRANFEWTDAEGRIHSGRGYAFTLPQAGAEVPLMRYGNTFLPEGLFFSPLGGERFFAFFMTAFALGILVFLGFSFRSSLRKRHILCCGTLVPALETRRRATNLRVNGRQQYEIFFTFISPADGSAAEASVKTTDTDSIDAQTQPFLILVDDRCRMLLLKEELKKGLYLKRSGDFGGKFSSVFGIMLVYLFFCTVLAAILYRLKYGA